MPRKKEIKDALNSLRRQRKGESPKGRTYWGMFEFKGKKKCSQEWETSNGLPWMSDA